MVAYIFAAPVAIPGFAPTRAPTWTPGNPVRLTNASSCFAVGANKIDSLTGFNGYTDINGNGTVEQTEIRTIPGSLLNKALTAQVIFDNGFLLPFRADDAELLPDPGQQPGLHRLAADGSPKSRVTRTSWSPPTRARRSSPTCSTTRTTGSTTSRGTGSIAAASTTRAS